MRSALKILLLIGGAVIVFHGFHRPAPRTLVGSDPEPEIIISEEKEQNQWSEEEAEVLAKMLWGEARGVQSDTEKAACVWCVLNRVDSYGKSIIEVTTAPKQFVGYKPDNPVDQELKDLCEDVLSRYFAEKEGQEDVGRVLPPDYLFFSCKNSTNVFRNAFKGGQTWDWSLPSPYES